MKNGRHELRRSRSTAFDIWIQVIQIHEVKSTEKMCFGFLLATNKKSLSIVSRLNVIHQNVSFPIVQFIFMPFARQAVPHGRMDSHRSQFASTEHSLGNFPSHSMLWILGISAYFPGISN